jgi:hypothetical protein
MANDGFEEGTQVFELPQAIRLRQLAPHLFVDGLLFVGMRIHEESIDRRCWIVALRITGCRRLSRL